MDRRLTPANGRVAHVSLQGQVTAERFVTGTWRRIAVPLVDILARPDGPRDRQILMGARVLVLEETGEFAFIQAARDGYVGYIRRDTLCPDAEATHWVSAPATHLYPEPSIKSREIALLSMNARLTIAADHGKFLETTEGAYVYARHVRPVGDWAEDPVSVAAGLLGTPYLWGGDSRSGIDCSGLVQAAMSACGVLCPSDSDLQQAGFGHPLAKGEAPRRGDLVFWKGHVAFVSGPDQILHANAHAMAVTYEGMEAAIKRIEAAGEGKPTAMKRVEPA